jgi:hypothetical protein
MVALETIISATGNSNPNLDEIFKYLDQIAGPDASEKEPLKVIAPVVSELHDNARDLEFDLAADNQQTKRKAVVVRTFNRVTDLYVIMMEIDPPKDPVQKLQFDPEIEFTRKLIGISFRLLKEIGGENAGYKDPLNLTREMRIPYATELGSLREKHPMPGFARQENMARQSIFVANVSWIIFFIYIFAELGGFNWLYETIAELFSGK